MNFLSFAAIGKSGFLLVDHFTLPDEAWWDDFYTPMERRIEELRGKYACDAEALGVLDQREQEPEMHRRHSDYYAYEFFVTRRPALSVPEIRKVGFVRPGSKKRCLFLLSSDPREI